MSDVRLNDKSVASDAAYIYAETASGEQVRISKADLATVVAGVYKVGSADANTIFTNENRRCGNDVSNLPPDDNYGLLFTRGIIGWFCYQIFMSTNGHLYKRIWVNSWNEWTIL